MRDSTTPERVLAVGAHPDDIEFGCGATLARWSRTGARVHLLVLTDGSKGSWDKTADLAGLAATRQREQRDAADALGATEVSFIGAVDGELTVDRTTIEAVVAVIRQVRPTVMLGHDPWKRYRLHPDHRNAGWLTVDALVAARDPHFFPADGERPHRPDRLLLFEADEVDHLERVEAIDASAKLAALACHRSQWHSTMGIEDGPHMATQRAAFEHRILEELDTIGRALNAPAEGFKLLTDL
ncbi:MAG TPA: PIG-L deacetylase family protein [Acidimicrobiia bacterium]|nr:PIG-L deacetylase family protein [Acidimicrobiia bacterium]